eukprot:scaffold108616_cov20-Tisochrysis_lutea.AAC.1
MGVKEDTPCALSECEKVWCCMSLLHGALVCIALATATKPMLDALWLAQQYPYPHIQEAQARMWPFIILRITCNQPTTLQPQLILEHLKGSLQRSPTTFDST